MKIVTVLILAVALLGTSCKKRYEKGFAKGEDQGIAEGRSNGDADGYSDGYNSVYANAYNNAHSEGQSDGHTSGVADGKDYYLSHTTYADGHADGWEDNYSVGQSTGYTNGYNSAYNPAYNNGYAANGTNGYNQGYGSGYSSGYNNGHYDGSYDGYNAGYNNGYDDGYYDNYNDGYYDGYDAGIGSSVKTSNPSVKFAAMVNQDLFDYSKMQKFSSSSALDGGAMALNHADAGSVDMEKLAALKEQHYLSQMASQLQAKFGLNAERSQKIATVAHQFNKLAGTRELTQKDSDIFAKGVIGKSIKEVEAAVKKSLKGDSTDLNTLLEQIAQVNDTTPENVGNIINQIFF